MDRRVYAFEYGKWMRISYKMRKRDAKRVPAGEHCLQGRGADIASLGERFSFLTFSSFGLSIIGRKWKRKDVQRVILGKRDKILGMHVVRERVFYTQVIQIMIPVALQQAINMGVNMMDTMMLGSFGEAQLSASSLANSFYNLFVILCMGINGGCSVLAAQYWGAGDKKMVRETFNLAIRLATVLSLLFAAATAIFPEQIMKTYSNEADVIAYGVKYLKITAIIYSSTVPAR